MWQFLTGLGVTIVFLAVALPFRKRNKAPRFVTACHFIAGCGLAGGIFGAVIDSVVGMVPQSVVAVIAIALTAIFGIGLVLDLKDGKPDKQAQWVALGLPILFILLPGSFGAQTENLVNRVNESATTVVSQVDSR